MWILFCLNYYSLVCRLVLKNCWPRVKNWRCLVGRDFLVVEYYFLNFPAKWLKNMEVGTSGDDFCKAPISKKWALSLTKMWKKVLSQHILGGRVGTPYKYSTVWLEAWLINMISLYKNQHPVSGLKLGLWICGVHEHDEKKLDAQACFSEKVGYKHRHCF